MSEVEVAHETVADTSNPPPIESAPTETAPTDDGSSFSQENLSALNEVMAKYSPKKSPTSSGKSAVAAEIVDPKAASAAAQVFTPNLKFKVKDKEHEIPSYMKDVIKDAKTEKEVKEIFEKAYGLEGIKEQREGLKKERDQYFGQVNELVRDINLVKADYQRGDMDSMFAKLNIPVEKVLQYALQKAQYLELPPEQREQIDRQRSLELQTRQLDSQNQSLTANLQQQLVQAKSDAFNATMSRPEVTSVEQAFDTQAGRQGAFRQLVQSHGELTWQKSNGKVDLTPQQAIEQVIAMYGLKAGSAAPAAAVTAASVVPPAATPASTKPASTIIPNIQGKSTSPLKSKPRSIEDIQKISKEKYG